MSDWTPSSLFLFRDGTTVDALMPDGWTVRCYVNVDGPEEVTLAPIVAGEPDFGHPLTRQPCAVRLVIDPPEREEN